MFKYIPGAICSVRTLRRSFIRTTTVDSDKSLIKVSESDGVREIMLNQPKIRNTLSMEVMDLIIGGLTENVNNESLRCIVISSTGPVFSAGHNINQLLEGPECQRAVFDKCVEMISKIRHAPVPVIAKVDGLASAAGCQLVASCDILVCSEKSTFSTAAANFGLFCHTPAVPLSRAMPRMKSLYMLIAGFPISAQEAYISGLVSVVAKNDKLDEEVSKICDSIKNKSRPVIQHGKEAFYKQLGLNVDDAYELATEAMMRNLRLNDGKDGIQCFVDKKKPKWTHS